ncbi:UDP-3-O-(3-hydroxymyristoyl)glucosamine N-acyltransferase [Phycisphaerales bacterium AB-hyl4]|uniref:UDP-3-O-acylglucosamine N-acyltransferase n=1 Tax=Natronomicrosphaera hydrolytica TaxID=3242702 RepID=A0ABV4U162_9BACT
MSMTANDLARRIGATVQGNGDVELTGCATLEQAQPSDVSFLANRKYAKLLGTTQAGAVVVSADDVRMADDRLLLIADDPYFAFRQAMVELVGFRSPPAPGISEQASIASSATIGRDCYIGPFAVVSEGAVVGDGCVLYPHSYVGRGATVGDQCTLHPGVTVYDACRLGSRVTLHAGCSIGQDGFGYATHGEPGQPPVHHKIPPAGNVVIEDDVEMGAHCSVDRATMGSTVVGRGSKFSNGVTIGHGSKVGPFNLLVAQVGLAGSVTTGAYVAMGGQVGVAGHLKVGDQTQIAAKSGVASDVPDKVQFGGAPAQPFADAKRQILAMTRLPDLVADSRKMRKRIEKLEAKLAELEAASEE